MRACMLCQLCQPSERPGGAPISCPRLAVPSAPPLARGWCVRLIMHLTLFHATCQRGREKRGGAGGDAASARAQRGRRVTPPHPTSMRQAGLDPGVRPCPPPTQRPAGWPRQAPAAAAARRLGVCGGGGRGGRGVGAQEGGELHGGWRKGRQARGRGAPTLLPTHPDTHSPAPCARPPHALTRLPRPMRAPAPCAHPSSPPRPAAAAPARAHGHPGWRRRGPGCPPTCQEQGRGGGLGALGAREGRGVGGPRSKRGEGGWGSRRRGGRGAGRRGVRGETCSRPPRHPTHPSHPPTHALNAPLAGLNPKAQLPPQLILLLSVLPAVGGAQRVARHCSERGGKGGRRGGGE